MSYYNTTRITLTNVMLGIWRLSLHTKMTPTQFRFFWGLILKHNEFGYKEPFTLNTYQMCAAAGVQSRQHINELRRSISKLNIDGEWILKYKSGNFGRQTSATYKINYDLLLRQIGIWQASVVQPSIDIDSSVDGSVDYPQIRGEKKGWMDGAEVWFKKNNEGEFNRALERLTAYQVNVRKELLLKYHPEYINIMIDNLEGNGQDVRDMAGLIVHTIRDEENYRLWLAGVEVIT